LGDADADDAFQATFLVLARKARAVAWRDSIGGWLHAVAQRVARKAQATAAKAAALPRRLGPGEVLAMPDADPLTHASRQELRVVLDEELARLPEKYRAPLVLCYLEGRTNEEAAGHLGWTKGTVSGRLSRARALLQRRLVRRGLALSAGTLAGLLPTTSAEAAVPEAVTAVTLQAALLDGTTLPGVVSANVLRLTNDLLHSYFVLKVRFAAVLALVGLLGTVVVALAASHAIVNEEPEMPPAASQSPLEMAKAKLDPMEFVTADITLFLGRDGVAGEPVHQLTRSVIDQASLAKFAACFPGMATGKRNDKDSGWLSRVAITFHRRNGTHAVVKSSWTDWTEGTGNWKVGANLMKHTGELFAVPRLADLGNLMDPWHVVGLEVGGKKRNVNKGELFVTPETFSYRLITYTKIGISFDGRIDYESPRLFGVDPNKEPRELTCYSGFGKKQPMEQGIYAFTGDTLKICLDKSGLRRPAAFKTEPGNTKQLLLILERGSAVSTGK
jgi:RNA polymerase sigma factor (sigma-70 family)